MNKRILALIAAHVVAFVGISTQAFRRGGEDVPTTLFLALVFAEVGVLALWAALGKGRWYVRLLCVTAVLFVIWGVTIAAQRPRPDLANIVFVWLVFSVPCATTSLVLALRRRKRNLALRRTSETISHEGFQFSIKHLFIGTACVAVVLSVGKVTRTLQPDVDWVAMLIVLMAIFPGVVVVGLATFWAALGLGRPLLRLSAVVPSAFVIGLVPPFCLEENGRPGRFLVWSAMIGTSGIILAGTLLVVRSVGWRLCSASERPERDEAIGAGTQLAMGSDDEG